MVDMEDLKKAMKWWYWYMYEAMKDDEEFDVIMAKYKLTYEDIGVK